MGFPSLQSERARQLGEGGHELVSTRQDLNRNMVRACGNVLELTAPEVSTEVRKAASGEGFRPETTTLEIAGLCPRCQSEPGHD